MPSIHQTSVEEVIAQCPAIEPLDVEWLRECGPAVFLCAAGFEGRFDEVASLLVSAGCRLRRAIVLTLSSNTEKDVENCRQLRAMLKPLCEVEPETLDADSPNFSEMLRSVLDHQRTGDSGTRDILFDISVAANRLILRTLKVLLEGDNELTIGYSEAKLYHPEQAEFKSNEEAWTSDETLGTEKGVEEITRSMEFPGEHLDSVPNVVILFPSFRHERSAAVVSHVDPALSNRPTDDVVWVLGRPHLEKDLWRREAMRKINRIADDAKVLETCTFDYREAWALLESVYAARWESSNLTISPLGSKMQAVAITLFCLRHPDVRVLFSIPKQYNTQQWSDGVRATWRVSFGLTGDLIERILRAESLRLEGFES